MTPWRVGIVGSEAAKFMPETEAKARQVIRDIIVAADESSGSGVAIISGGCHLGGIDIWAMEEGEQFFCYRNEEYKPTKLQWSGPGGYMERNLKIASRSNEIHCITVEKLPKGYTGVRFETCYHCAKWAPTWPAHVKSGGCWTMHQHQLRDYGKGYLHVIKED